MAASSQLVEQGSPDSKPKPVGDIIHVSTPSEPVSGRILLASGDELPCTATLFPQLHGIITVKAEAALGEFVICYLDNVGILVGKVTELHQTGLRVAFNVKDHRREKVVARLDWHTAQAHRSAQLRRAPRLTPLHRSVEVRLAESFVVAGRILNISISGAAIALDSDPGVFVGSLVRAGSRFATVVRVIDGGIGVQFVEPFAPDSFDERVRL